VINEAALLTARNEKRAISNYFLEESIDRVDRRPGAAYPRDERQREEDHRVPRGRARAGGVRAAALRAGAQGDDPAAWPLRSGTRWCLPTEDKYTQTRAEMIDTLAYALGGRAAEELVFHEPTTGAGNDIEKASGLARAMVTQYGMSSKLGAVKYGTSGDEPFMGRNMGHEKDYSDSVAADIDSEVRALIELAHDEAWEILVEYRDVLDNMVLELIEKETITQDDMNRICERVQKRPPMAPFNGFGKRLPSEAPPVLTPAERDKLKAQAEADGQIAVGGSSTPNGSVEGQPLSTDEPDYLAARLVDGKLTGTPVEQAVDLARIEESGPGDPHRHR
jgi:cell division protease FtsH